MWKTVEDEYDVLQWYAGETHLHSDHSVYEMMTHSADFVERAKKYTNHTGAHCSGKQLHNYLKSKKKLHQTENKQYIVSGAEPYDPANYNRLYQEIHNCMVIADVKNQGNCGNRRHISHQVSIVHV